MRKRLFSECARSALDQCEIRVITTGLSNHTVNKSRAITVESLITISDAYEKIFDCTDCACV